MNRKRAAQEQRTRLGVSEDTLTARVGEVIEAENEAVSALARPGEVQPPVLHVLPVSERPFLPGRTMPLILPEAPWLETVERVAETPHNLVALLLTRSERSGRPALEDFYAVGTVVRMQNPERHEGRIQFMAEGVERFHVQD